MWKNVNLTWLFVKSMLLSIFAASQFHGKLPKRHTVWKIAINHDHNFYGTINIISVKSTFLLKSWFHEIFYRAWGAIMNFIFFRENETWQKLGLKNSHDWGYYYSIFAWNCEKPLRKGNSQKYFVKLIYSILRCI